MELPLPKKKSNKLWKDKEVNLKTGSNVSTVIKLLRMLMLMVNTGDMFTQNCKNHKLLLKYSNNMIAPTVIENLRKSAG